MPLLSTHHHLLRFHTFPSTSHRPLTPSISLPSAPPLPRPPLTRQAHPPLRHVAFTNPGAEEDDDGEGDDELGPTSAEAVAAAIRRASSASPVRFRRRRAEEEEQQMGEGAVDTPSADFRRLCAEQLEMFRTVICRHAVLSVYVRPAGSYIMNQLELRRVALYPEIDVPERENVLLVGNFSVPAGLRAAEASLVKHQMEVLPEFGATVLPMVKHPFVVGFLVAELPELDVGTSMNSYTSEIQLPSGPCIDGSFVLTPYSKGKNQDFQTPGDEVKNHSQLVIEWKTRALMISQTLAMAYVMDQKAFLLQQTSWQNNFRMSGLVEQIRGPLSNVRALAKMLSLHTKRSEIPYDIVEDILIQGDHMNDALQQVQDAVYVTKENIIRYNGEALKKIQGSRHGESHTLRRPDYESTESGNSRPKVDPMLSLSSDKKDVEMPMPPLWLAPLRQNDARQTMQYH